MLRKRVEKIKKICKFCNKEFEVLPCNVNRYVFCSKECKFQNNNSIKLCDYCEKEFTHPKSQGIRKCCSPECDTMLRYKKEKRKCRFCGIKFSVNKSSDDLCCSKECYCSWKESHGRIDYSCDCCGKIFNTLRSKVAKNKNGCYCSQKCSQIASVTGELYNCTNCGKEIYRTPSSNTDNKFCSSECNHMFYHKNNSVKKKCEYCEKSYDVQKSRKNVSKFCSMLCRNKWESENKIGENNPSFTSIKSKCDYCNKIIYIKQHKYKTQNKHFCSYICTSSFYKIKENRTIKQLAVDERIGKEAIKYIKPTLTKPHVAINNILSELNVIYRNEENITYSLLDIYLPDYNLAIEVQGDFWHCSPLKFSEVKYTQQLNSIRRDKSKHTYVKNKFGYEILYLWEKDISANSDLCKLLIEKYIQSSGKLENYQSFNYKIVDGCLFLSDEIITPYQDVDKKDLNINIKNKAT